MARPRLGSRPGGLLACAWAAMVAIGEQGYSEKARGINEAAKVIKAGVPRIPGLELLGESHSTVIAIKSHDHKSLNIYKVNDQMSKRGWNLNSVHKPEAIHICLTAQSIGRGEEFLVDLAASVAHVQANPDEKGGNAALYGLAATFPDRSSVADVARILLDCISTPPAPVSGVAHAS